MTGNKSSNDGYIAAIYEGTVCSSVSPGSKAKDTCNRIDEMVSSAALELEKVLKAENIYSRRVGESRHYHEFELEVRSDQVSRVTEILKQKGYQQWAPLKDGALRCYLNHFRSMMFIRDSETAMRVQLRWGKRKRVPRIFRPTIKILTSIDLPDYAWPLYYVVSPFHTIINRLRGLHHVPEIRPFLGTPKSLFQPLFELTELKSDDVFVDVGCGDGRVAIEATQYYGCRSIGIEYHSDIARKARKRVQEFGLESQVSIVEGDATNIDLSEATVMFVFLPMSTFKMLLPKLLSRVGPGTRIISHELRPLDKNFTPKPKRSVPLFGSDAITVAHVWVA